MATAAELAIIIKARDEASHTLRGIGDETQTLGSRITSFATKATIGIGAVSAGAFALKTAFVDAASDLNEAQSKANVTFGESSSVISDFASDSAQAFGVSKRAAFEYTATLGNILQASGLTKDASADMSVELTQLAADMASFNNLDFDVALDKIRAGLVGEAEPLRSVGVLLSEAAVQAKAYASGIAQQGAKLTDAQKVQARYQIILEQTTNSQGDFARTSEGVANQQRILAARMEDLRAEIGQKLLPVTAELFSLFNRGIDVSYDLGRALVALNEKFQAVGLGIDHVSDLLPSNVRALGDLRDILHGDVGAIDDFTIKLLGVERPVELAGRGIGKLKDLFGGGGGDSLEDRALAAGAGVSYIGDALTVMRRRAQDAEPGLTRALDITEENVKEVRDAADDARDALFKMFREPTLEEEFAELAIFRMREELLKLEMKGDDVTASERERADNLRNNLIPAAERQKELTGLQRDIYGQQITIQQGGIPTLDQWRSRVDNQVDSVEAFNTATRLANSEHLPGLLGWVDRHIDRWGSWSDRILAVQDRIGRQVAIDPRPLVWADENIERWETWLGRITTVGDRLASWPAIDSGVTDWVQQNIEKWGSWLDSIFAVRDAINEVPGGPERTSGGHRIGGAFGHGGVVPEDMLALVHRKEVILTPQQAAQQGIGQRSMAPAQQPGVVNHIEIHVTADSEIGETQMRKLARLVREEVDGSLRLTGLQGSFAGGGVFSP